MLPHLGEAPSFWTNLPHSHVSLEGDLNLPYSQISPTNIPHYTKYSKILFLIAVITYKWNLYVTTTIEND